MSISLCCLPLFCVTRSVHLFLIMPHFRNPQHIPGVAASISVTCCAVAVEKQKAICDRSLPVLNMYMSERSNSACILHKLALTSVWLELSKSHMVMCLSLAMLLFTPITSVTNAMLNVMRMSPILSFTSISSTPYPNIHRQGG